MDPYTYNLILCSPRCVQRTFRLFPRHGRWQASCGWRLWRWRRNERIRIHVSPPRYPLIAIFFFLDFFPDSWIFSWFFWFFSRFLIFSWFLIFFWFFDFFWFLDFFQIFWFYDFFSDFLIFSWFFDFLYRFLDFFLIFRFFDFSQSDVRYFSSDLPLVLVYYMVYPVKLWSKGLNEL